MSKKFSSVPYQNLTILQAAQFTGIDRRVIEDAIDAGELRVITQLRKITQVPSSELEAWFNTRYSEPGVQGAPPQPAKDPTGEWNKLLQCNLVNYEANASDHTVTLTVPCGHCTDFTGAVKYAQSVCPSVTEVRVEDTKKRLINIYALSPQTPFVNGNHLWLCTFHENPRNLGAKS